MSRVLAIAGSPYPTSRSALLVDLVCSRLTAAGRGGEAVLHSALRDFLHSLSGDEAVRQLGDPRLESGVKPLVRPRSIGRIEILRYQGVRT